jgi:hypothetical protein
VHDLAPRPARNQVRPAASDPFEFYEDEDGNLLEEGAIDSRKTSPGSKDDEVRAKDLKKQVAAVLATVVGQADEQPDPEMRALIEVRPDTQQGPIFVNIRCTLI